MTEADVPARPSLMPANTPDVMAPAWSTCMIWALRNDGLRAAFEAETGRRRTPPANGLERAVDEATGHGTGYVEAFVRWANVAVWGPMDGEGEP